MTLPIAILAGGFATRLGDLTRQTPKALLRVAGRPFILHQLELLKRSGVTDVVLCIGHLGESIERTVAEANLGSLNVQFSYDGDSPLGTGGAIRRALPLLGEAFFVTYGDTLLPLDYGAVQNAFVASGLPALMTILRNEGRWGTSNVIYRDSRIERYDKTGRAPDMDYIDYGLGVFRRDVFAGYATDSAFDLAGVYTELAATGRLAAYETRKRFYEIGTSAALAETSALLERQNLDAAHS